MLWCRVANKVLGSMSGRKWTCATASVRAGCAAHGFCTSISECSVARGLPWDRLSDSTSKHLEMGHHTHTHMHIIGVNDKGKKVHV